MALGGQYGDLEHKTKVKLSVMVGEVWAVWNYMVGFGASLYTVGNFSPLTADGEERSGDRPGFKATGRKDTDTAKPARQQGP